jgi:glycosyltransferase involved in cell wall biosynthesis
MPINIKSRCTVVTIFDFSFILYPQWHPKERINDFEEYFWKNLKRSDRIIVISDYIKKEGVNLGLPEEKLRTIHLGIDHEVFKTYPPQDLQLLRKHYKLPEHFILFVGSIEPRKNLENLVRSYINLDEGIRKDIKLVLAGFKGWENKEIMALLKEVKSDVLYLGYLPDKELGELYNLATLFVYPSMYEGFGLPPLEAMACCCPVVASNVASLPEVCGDAALYVDPHDVNSIAEGIHKVLTDDDLRQSLIEKGLERAKLFSWEKSAKEHIKVFEEVLGS